MWLVAVILDSIGTEHFYHHRKFCWTTLLQSVSSDRTHYEFLFFAHLVNSGILTNVY